MADKLEDEIDTFLEKKQKQLAEVNVSSQSEESVAHDFIVKKHRRLHWDQGRSV